MDGWTKVILGRLLSQPCLFSDFEHADSNNTYLARFLRELCMSRALQNMW